MVKVGDVKIKNLSPEATLFIVVAVVMVTRRHHAAREEAQQLEDGMTKKADILKATYKKMLASVGANSDHVGVGGQDGWCRRSTL